MKYVLRFRSTAVRSLLYMRTLWHKPLLSPEMRLPKCWLAQQSITVQFLPGVRTKKHTSMCSLALVVLQSRADQKDAVADSTFVVSRKRERSVECVP